MKTRMHRFWLSITLAASSLSSPLSPRAWSHDLPTRWTPETLSQARSDADWNYLLDDCLGSGCLESGPAVGATALVASSSQGQHLPSHRAIAPNKVDFDEVLSRDSLSRFSSEMAGWVNHWERLQAQAGQAARADLTVHRLGRPTLLASRPEAGYPPAPAVPQTDTCGFEAEYQAMQAAAELLEKEMAPATAAVSSAASSAVSNNAASGEPTLDRADLESALAAAAAIEAAQIDAMPATPSMPASPEAPAQCGGEQPEIVSLQRYWPTLSRAEIDEYMSYDVDPRDAHWMGGLGKSWKLSAALRGASNSARAAEDSQLRQRLADAIDWLDNASCIVAAELCGLERAEHVGSQFAQLAASAADQSMGSYVAIGHVLELPPAVVNPSLDVLVVYTDSDGNETTVPSSLARAWNRPERDETLDVFEAPEIVSAEDSDDPFAVAAGELPSSDLASNADEVTDSDRTRASLSTSVDATPPVDLGHLRRRILSLAAEQLDSLGLTCLETADRLSSWAQPRSASRDESEVR